MMSSAPAPIRAIAFTFVVAAGVLGVSPPAAAFVRYVTDANAPFLWTQVSVPITAYANDFTQTSMTGAEVANAVQQAAATWSAAANACTYLELVPTLSTAATPLAVNDGHNTIIFHSTVWCHVGASGNCDLPYDSSALAVTTDTANTKTGQIYDADVEVNLVNYQWADVVADPSFADAMDLQNALTHELGHMIGLDHSCFDPLTSASGVRPDGDDGQPIPDCATASVDVQATTMFPSATPGDVQKRTLAPDDQNAVCTIYPVDHPPPPPGSNVDGGCACAVGAEVDPSALSLLGLLGSAVFLRRRRARRAARGR